MHESTQSGEYIENDEVYREIIRRPQTLLIYTKHVWMFWAALYSTVPATHWPQRPGISMKLRVTHSATT